MLEWKLDYATGNRIIDAEHKILFEIANEFAGESKITLGKFKETYFDLIQYTTMHFSSEEAMLREIAYPSLATHQTSHARIIEEMKSLLGRSNNLDTLQKELERALQRWIVNHILREDMAYKPTMIDWREHRLGYR
jgi:hemerythrin-like metal-binding protein